MPPAAVRVRCSPQLISSATVPGIISTRRPATRPWPATSSSLLVPGGGAHARGYQSDGCRTSLMVWRQPASGSPTSSCSIVRRRAEPQERAATASCRRRRSRGSPMCMHIRTPVPRFLDRRLLLLPGRRDAAAARPPGRRYGGAQQATLRRSRCACAPTYDWVAVHEEEEINVAWPGVRALPAQRQRRQCNLHGRHALCHPRCPHAALLGAEDHVRTPRPQPTSPTSPSRISRPVSLSWKRRTCMPEGFTVAGAPYLFLALSSRPIWMMMQILAS
ncbi:hypothetical protein BDA96_07G241200 [Sorghum bicolor]|uniref:Uncharacterized protein n=1 Tax=Sorghum bicolor TaxID=4558 RepID=A0A921QMK0_SORBI|nr:uncharacterized protein LOC110437186 [Sorghum bicolor]KAG0524783.1 hypothetical protein BDA96_07G241200 [Sorghum bicolor]|eukprot:XP_021321208.1 uncharacterized protein LOC110437186 [Sorghum bicolor]